MPTEIKQKLGTAIVWADSAGDYSSTVSGLAATHQLTLASLANGSWRQGAKADLGSTMAARYSVMVAFEIAVAPASGAVIPVWLGFSPSATAGNANPGGMSGADAAYSGTAGDSDDDSAKQMLHAGNLVCTSDATTVVQYQTIGVIAPTNRYVSVAVDNASGQALHSDDVEMYVALVPIIDESQ